MKYRKAIKPRWQNWTGSVQCDPPHRSEPLTIEEIQSEIVRVAEDGERLRVIGNGGSVAPLCWADDSHMSLRRFSGLEALDAQRRRVWVRAGTTLAELYTLLAERDLAIDNGPSLNWATIGGAISTATHGSGMAFGNLASLVTGLRLVLADGTVRQCSRDEHPDLFAAARVGLGTLGVITHVELQCVNHYRLRVVRTRASFGETLARLTDIRREHRNLELYWFPYARTVLQRAADETREAPAHPFSVRALRNRVQDKLLSDVARRFAQRSPQSAERAASFLVSRMNHRTVVLDAERAYHTARRSRVLQLEYAIPIARIGDTLRQLERLIQMLDFRIHVPIEIRFVRADDAWLSPQYERDSACITLPAYRDRPHDNYYAALGELFDRVDGRPHWATAHGKTADELRPLYPRFDDFCRLRETVDPRGLLLNPYLARLLGATLR